MEYQQTLAKAISYLSIRDHSVYEIRQKLGRKGFSEDSIKAVISYLLEKELLNDHDFSCQWIRMRLRRHPEGRSLLFLGLLKKGISRETAETTLAEVCTTEYKQEAINQAAQKIEKKYSMDKQKFIQKLLSRGFSMGEVRQYLEE